MSMPGLTWDDLEDTLTVPRIQAYNKYWVKHPPVHVMVAAYLGYKPKESGKYEDLMAMFPQEIPHG